MPLEAANTLEGDVQNRVKIHVNSQSSPHMEVS